ncbi:hypothetical protein E2C01_011862 [Portunus trituberculatus]|uniref:Uncharacterized protein n=1 Tax=Portunus trituberculatus TaxID=210409 RepID=A0A5B7DC30_PORTR|nr:hypothetical protein [Portunus trituberculatus]
MEGRWGGGAGVEGRRGSSGIREGGTIWHNTTVHEDRLPALTCLFLPAVPCHSLRPPLTPSCPLTTSARVTP